MPRQSHKASTAGPVWNALPASAPSLLRDFPIVLAALALFYALLATTHTWMGPVSEQAQIQLRMSALPAYAMYSFLRITIAYLLSLVFAVAYGYVAAYNARAEAQADEGDARSTRPSDD